MPAKKIIVIEDEPDIREVIAYNLLREGFDAHGVGDGEEGLRAIRATPPDLVALDLMLPEALPALHHSLTMPDYSCIESSIAESLDGGAGCWILLRWPRFSAWVC